MRSLELFVQMRWNSTEEESSPKLIDWLSLESLGSVSTFEARNYDERAFRLHETLRSTIMKILGLRGLEERRVAELSNGELRRVVIARALLSRPKLLLLDAPFAGLDVDGRSRLMGMLNHLMTVGRVSFMITSTRLEDLPSSVTNVIELADDSSIKRIGPAIVAGKHAPTSRRRGLSGEPSQGPVRLASSGPLSRGIPVVEMNGVNVSYGRHEVLRDFNWAVKRGERWLVTGSNGSGKSTLAALIVGDHLQAYSNDIRIFGKRRGQGDSIWAIKKRIGWMSPELQSMIDATQTVLETVMSSPHCSASKKSRIEALLWLDRFGIEDKANTPFGAVSSGEQRLVLFARTLMGDPRVLVLNEPCENLDEPNRDLFLKLLSDVCEDLGTTLIYITHRPDAVPACITNRLAAGSRDPAAT